VKRTRDSETTLQNVNLKSESTMLHKLSGLKKSEDDVPGINSESYQDKNDTILKSSQADYNSSVLGNLLVLEERIKERTSQLESFTHAVSHDLRAPVRCINRFSKVLLNDYISILDDTGINYVQTIYNKAQQMGNLIDILFSFFVAGHRDLNKTELNIEAIVNEIINEQRIYYQKEFKFISRQFLLPSYGDRELIKLVFSNLISNAIKFTNKKSRPKIIIGSYSEKDEVVYYVRDNGEGFDMDNADKLFCAFQRLHKSDEFEGTGIGLSIVGRVINKHEGKVWAEGKLKEGATFYFSLPVIG
jgi:light-regulated signal transduction histidine kinase (bacteriophytochrome)